MSRSSEFDKPARRARVAIEGYLQTESAPLTIPAIDDEQRVIVKLPDGFEYTESEVALAKTLTSTGEIKYDWKDTHSSLAEFEHTNETLVA